jgi:GNAT superfamily N-acetyltransferase
VPRLPELDGVEFRHFRGPDDDYPHLVRLINEASRGEGHDRVETVEGLASYYDHLERCDPATDLLMAEAGGEPVAFTRVAWGQEVDGPRVYSHVCFVDPAFGARGIGAVLMAWNEARLREIAAGHADASEQVFEVWANDANAGARALFSAAGYEPCEYAAEMVRPSVEGLPDHPLPEGLEIRPVREEDLRAIWEADAEAFRDHWGFVEPTEASFRQFLAFPYADPTLWKVAWDDEGVAGQVRSYVDSAQNAQLGRERGWTENISTARRWRRRGLAKALIVESIRELAARGVIEVALGVHTGNPNGAYDLYLGLGYEVVATWTTYRKPL